MDLDQQPEQINHQQVDHQPLPAMDEINGEKNGKTEMKGEELEEVTIHDLDNRDFSAELRFV